MSTLVTGGTGFLGRNLVERLLAEGRMITVLGRTPSPELERRGVSFIRASLDDEASIMAACKNIETVFHVAARVGVWGRYDDYYRTNVLGTRALLAGCRQHGVKRLIYTSTPSVIYNGRDHAGSDESLPLTTDCPSPYPLTKALAEREVLEANSTELRTVALRPHLIWGVGDPHLVPRVLARARAGKLRIIGTGQNRVDMVHISNAVDAHLLAEQALKRRNPAAAGRAYFITNDEPVVLWDWINGLLTALGEPPVAKKISLGAANIIGSICESAWSIFPLKNEPPMTRFIAKELATDHWFDISAAKRDFNYVPRMSMAAGTTELVASYLAKSKSPPMNPRQIILPALAMAAIVLLSNVLVQFPLNAWLTWGAFSYPIAYLVTDVCNRVLGPQLARRVAWIGFAIGLTSSALLAPVRIAIASGAAFIVSQLLDVAIFNRLRQQSWWKAPFLGSSAASVVDTGIFFSLAFAGTSISWLHLAVGDLGVKLAMAGALLPAYRWLIKRLVKT